MRRRLLTIHCFSRDAGKLHISNGRTIASLLCCAAVLGVISDLLRTVYVCARNSQRSRQVEIQAFCQPSDSGDGIGDRQASRGHRPREDSRSVERTLRRQPKSRQNCHASLEIESEQGTGIECRHAVCGRNRLPFFSSDPTTMKPATLAARFVSY